MTLFITSDTSCPSQKYFLALVMKVKLSPHNQLSHHTLTSSGYMSFTLDLPNTPKMPADRQIQCQNSCYRACYITEAEGKDVIFNSIVKRSSYETENDKLFPRISVGSFLKQFVFIFILSNTCKSFAFKLY